MLLSSLSHAAPAAITIAIAIYYFAICHVLLPITTTILPIVSLLLLQLFLLLLLLILSLLLFLLGGSCDLVTTITGLVHLLTPQAAL